VARLLAEQIARAQATTMTIEYRPGASGIIGGNQQCAELLANSSSLIGGLAIDRALDLEQGVDAPNRLKRNWRDRRCGFALRLATGILGHIRHDEERAAGMNPTRGFQMVPGLRSGSYSLLYPL
jgi:hypothetical protein